MPSVGQGKGQSAHIPINILLLLQPLDVEIRNCHGQSVVESYSAQRERHTETWHAGHIFRDGDNTGVGLVQQLVREHKVYNSFLVHRGAEVLVVTTAETPGNGQHLQYVKMRVYSRSNAVVGVQHTRNTIEAETIELVLLHPEAQIAKKEAQDLVATVVEQPAVP
jgi:hypothetical protein